MTTKITIDRAALKLALEYRPSMPIEVLHDWAADMKKAAQEAMEEQPAEQEQEPVAAQCRFEGEAEWKNCTVAHHLYVQAYPKEWPHYTTRALYTAAQPAKRVPLTDEEISDLADSTPVDEISDPDTWHIRLARAIEAAHGITGDAE